MTAPVSVWIIGYDYEGNGNCVFSSRAAAIAYRVKFNEGESPFLMGDFVQELRLDDPDWEVPPPDYSLT